ncbi:hypothetical protein [Legionella maioricensis]|uniref:Uncharacterized protein n=1 Tax=Legionella maioricensis TaxID=2896528 RepID=A0A9X2IAU7_9GAMM|nr:hypothetical protein [Legionella maioricensis]MCL9684319.1 hypothetical protein [Legionella maioricensis]MCL9687185.1 hypothetical protein [Legionella maioricensis]
MQNFSPAWPHGKIRSIFDDVFLVTGSNITQHNGLELQHSRNMVIIREGTQLSLINTVRLTEEGLHQLEDLGEVKNIIRIGAFHGRDDAFYKQTYNAKLYALEGLQDQHQTPIDVILRAHSELPIVDSSLFIFNTSQFPEGILHLQRNNGIIITCDSIKNWLKADEYFSEQSAAAYKEQGFFEKASISKIWQQACKVQGSDFKKLLSYNFCHLLSAHGEPLLNTAYQDVQSSIQKAYPD